MNLQGILFDIDGTLIDSNDIHCRAWLEAFEHFDRPQPWELMRGQIGKGGDLLVPDLLNARDMRKFGEELKKHRGELFKKKYMKTIEPFPRVKEMFEELRGRGVKLALASSSNPDEVDYYTGLLGVGDLVAGTTSKEDAEMSKPSPEIFRAALERTGTDPARTFAVGDTPYDVLAAHRIPVPVVAVLCGGFPRETLAKAEFLFADVAEMVRKIDEVDGYFDEDDSE